METETVLTPRQKPLKTRARIWVLWIVLCLLSATSGFFVHFYVEQHRPNMAHTEPDFKGLSKPIFYNGEMIELSAIGNGESLKLPFSLVKELIDPSLLYEEHTESIIVTTKDKVVKLNTDRLTALMNEQPFDLRFPVEKVEGKLYLPIEPLKQLYGIELRESENPGTVMLFKDGDILQWGKVLTDSEQHDEPLAIRAAASIKAPIIADLSSEEEVMIWEESSGWYRIQLANGVIGFADKNRVALERVEVISTNREKHNAFVPWKPLGGKINLTWEHVLKHRSTDTNKIDEMPGLNVISPTWFHLMGGEGSIESLADPAYVKWAHERGYQVWALFSNSFKPEWTSEALSSYDTRMNMIKQLVAYAEMYDLQGINIDFENVYLKDGPLLTQFVRELVPFMHEQGLVVSIDVTIRGGSEMWSLFYDREQLGQLVDYMMVMTYDEHWASSPKSGSVASLPWVEKGIVDIIKKDHVPSSKLLLGVPYYTRIWTEESKDGKTAVTSKAVSMDGVQRWIRDRKLTPVYLEEEKQHYVEYVEGDSKYRIWIEDETSMRSRIQLVHKYDLAGVASWRRGFEQPPIWNVINEELKRRP
jgi:spore germination protein YaaH